MRELKETLAALGAGVAIAAIVACGGAQKSASAPGTRPASDAMPTGVQDPRIVELDAKITAEMSQLGVERPIPPPPTMGGPEPVAVHPTVGDPTCKPAETQICKDTCALTTSICANAEQICKIAKELGNDAWANDKCSSGNASCETARGKCCGCT